MRTAALCYKFTTQPTRSPTQPPPPPFLSVSILSMALMSALALLVSSKKTTSLCHPLRFAKTEAVFKDKRGMWVSMLELTNPLMSSLLVIFVRDGEAILKVLNLVRNRV